MLLLAMILECACTAPALQQTNITGNTTPSPSVPAGPMGPADAALGHLLLDDSRVQSIRDAIAKYVPFDQVIARIDVNPNQTPNSCLKANETAAPNFREVCLRVVPGDNILGPIHFLSSRLNPPPADVFLQAFSLTPIDLGIDDADLNIKFADPTTVPFGVLGEFRNPAASPGYSIELHLDPQLDVTASGSPGAGLWFHLRALATDEGGGPQNLDNWTKTFECNCSKENGGLVNPVPLPNFGGGFPESGCRVACKKAENFWLNQKGGSVFITPYCSSVKIKIRINFSSAFVGFIPSLPAKQGSGAWTSGFFAGAKDFHLGDMFDLQPLQQISLNVVAHGHDFAAVDADTESDVALALQFSNDCGLALSPDWNVTAIVHTVAEAYAANQVQQAISHVSDTASAALQPLLAPLANFDQALPPQCNLDGTFPQPPPPGTCSKSDAINLLSASLSYQKWDWFAGAFGPYGCQLHTDGANGPTACPPDYGANTNGGHLIVTGVTQNKNPHIIGSEFDSVDFQFDADPDGDGVLTPNDNCWQISNPDQADCDRDGVGDACQICPCDPKHDIDGDGACGPPDATTDCPGNPHCNDPIDNCPTVFNKLQANTTAVSEMFHTPDKIWGDACDPVPAPENRAMPSCVPEAGGGGPIVGSYCDVCTRDLLDVVPLRSSRCDPSIDGCALGNPNGFGVGNVATSFWFCQKNAKLNIFCNQGADITDDWVTVHHCAPMLDNPAPCDKVETQNDHFHRISNRKAFENIPLPTGPNDPPPMYDYVQLPEDPNADFQARQWEYQADFTRWTTLAVPLVTNAKTVRDLLGTMWIHADTLVGDSDLSLGTGHHGHQLANHHDLDYAPEYEQCADYFPQFVAINAGALISPILFLVKNLPDPAPDPLLPIAGSTQETQVLMGNGSGQWGLLANNGVAQIATSRLGANLLNSLADPTLTWANAVEPFAGQGAGPGFPTAVGLSADGSQITDTMTLQSGKLLGALDQALALPARTGSPHATGYTAVLSRYRHGVFVVGGVRPETNAPTHETWFMPLEQTRWSLVRSSLAPERVLAATYSYASDELIILDQLPDDSARLWAVHMADFSTRMLAETPQFPAAFDRHDLVIDADGSLLVALSSTAMQRHVIARLDLRQTNAPFQMAQFQIAQGDRALALPPLVDRNGYSLMIAPPPDWPDEVIAADRAVTIGHDATITGQVAVASAVKAACGGDGNDDDEKGCDKDDNADLVVRHNAEIFGFLRGDSIRLQHDVEIHGAVLYNTLVNEGSIAGELITPLALPLNLAHPQLPNIVAAKGATVIESKQTVTLNPGAYGKLDVKGGDDEQPTVLTLARGDYDVASLKLGPNARVECRERCTLRVAGTVRAENHDFLGIAGDTSPAEFVLLVAGPQGDGDDKDDDGKATAVAFGEHSTVRARIYAPSGALAIHHHGDATGAFFARDILVGHHSKISKDESGIGRRRSSDLGLSASVSPLAFNPLASQP